MRTLMVSVGVLTLLTADARPASAAWNNVFQPTLFGWCRPKTTTKYVPVVAAATPVCASCATPAPAPAPAPCGPACSTSYVQRCYYQPITTYQTQTYYEPVTTYRTSYYYEPVTSYSYSCYYDPCTCSTQQVATPVTSYQLRAQQCPVQSWVQRCAQVPVTAYQKACYWQPQTTCCQTTTGPLIPATPVVASAAPMVAAPAVAASPVIANPAPAVVPNGGGYSAPPALMENRGAYSPPAVIENRGGYSPPAVIENRNGANGTTPPPVIRENPNGDSQYDRYYPNKQIRLQTPAPYMPPASRPVTPPPPVKLDRIVVGPDARVEGQIVRSDNTPRPGARVLFVSADRLAPNQTVFGDHAGRFTASLAPGGWLVYLDAPDGTQLYHSRIDVNPNQVAARITLVNR
jgi:hypothetical protein